MTFDAPIAIPTEVRHSWQRWHEIFCVCRHCRRSTVFILAQKRYEDEQLLKNLSPTQIPGSLNRYFSVEGYISQKDTGAATVPEHVKDPVIANAFREGAVSLVVGNWNAAGTMFRLAIDLTTRPMLPREDVLGLNKRTRRDLGLRLPWLFDNRFLPNDLRELSSCVREDGNDGAHAGTLTKEDAQDLLDFTSALLARIFTEPERLRLAAERRDQRREPKSQAS
jgi:Domain of unknown function (DUF4145)